MHVSKKQNAPPGRSSRRCQTPAIGLAMVGTAAVGIAHGDSVGAVMLTIALVAVALQIGYLFGLVMRAIIVSLGVPERKAVMVEKLGIW